MSVPTLVVEKGLPTPRKHELPPGEYVIGRDVRAEIPIENETVSRIHAKIIADDKTVTIYDCGSRNGVVVNKVRVQQSVLSHGDIIELGTVVFRFEWPSSTELTFKIEDKEEIVSKIAELGVLPTDKKALETLYRVGQIINSTLALQELVDRLMETILDVIEAERGAILLRDELSGELSPGTVRCKTCAVHPEAMAVSRTIVNRVLGDGVGVICTDARTDKRFDASASVEAFGIRSAMCVPITSKGRILGIIYVDHRTVTGLYTEEDLNLLGAIANQAAAALENARLHEELRLENISLRSVLGEKNRILGNSRKMRELLDIVKRVSQTDSTVLLRGESGTGKELIARAIHQTSARAHKPCVSVCCAAIPETLLESELFGYEKGAFTGATQLKRGKFELAHGGTIFLDEISEMPVSLQAKLLRVLETNEVDRIGGSRPITVDVRVIASTNRDLQAAIRKGEFREDLYYRLSVVEIVLPPLRERREDIPELTEYFLRMIAEEMARRPPRVSEEAMRILVTQEWRGNVRELRNVIERAMVLGVGDVLLPAHLPTSLTRPAGEPPTQEGSATLSEVERHHIESVLRSAGWNKSRAAELLGISRPRLNRKIKEYGLHP